VAKAKTGRTAASKRAEASKTKSVARKLAVRKTAPARATIQKPTSTKSRTTAKKLVAKRPAPKQAAIRDSAAQRKIGAKPSAVRRVAARSQVASTPRKANGLKRVTKPRTAAKPAARPRTTKQSTARPSLRTVETPRQAIRETAVVETRPTIDQVARDKEFAREHGTIAVNRALGLLETLARTGPVPLAVLADAAGCGKTAAFDLLTTMQARNFVIQDADHGLWRLGARWAVLGSAASEQGALAATAMPYLAGLGNATGENVYLRVREGMESETVAIYQTDPGLRVYTEVGKKMPLHAGSGRMLLAHAPEAVQTQVLAQRLQRYTPSTRTDPSWIAADLHRIRMRGFLITDSEVVAGTVSVCAPVRDASGQVVAAILIGAPSLRMRPPRPRALMPAVVEAARKLSHALGSISEQPEQPANPAMEPHHPGGFSGAWPTTALGAVISRPHSVFR
jgi:IclR family KDG regulon transcriptional repressor